MLLESDIPAREEQSMSKSDCIASSALKCSLTGRGF